MCARGPFGGPQQAKQIRKNGIFSQLFILFSFDKNKNKIKIKIKKKNKNRCSFFCTDFLNGFQRRFFLNLIFISFLLISSFFNPISMFDLKNPFLIQRIGRNNALLVLRKERNMQNGSLQHKKEISRK